MPRLVKKVASAQGNFLSASRIKFCASVVNAVSIGYYNQIRLLVNEGMDQIWRLDACGSCKRGACLLLSIQTMGIRRIRLPC